MIALTLATWAYAADVPSDPQVDTLVSAITRYKAELALPGAPPLYHLRYHLVSLEQAEAEASFGGLLRISADPYRALGVEVRLGSPAFDNTGFGGWENGFGYTGLPVGVDANALKLDAWKLTDRAYKEAVEQFSRKSAQFDPPENYPGDYTLSGPQLYLDPAFVPQTAPDRLSTDAQTLSAAFVGFPLEVGSVVMGHESGWHWIIDSEGTKVQRPMRECTVRAIARIRTQDGAVISDQRLWTAQTAQDLPATAEMVEQTAQLARELTAVSDAAPISEEYVGPVIFEDQAAVDLFRYLLVPQLEGTPAEVPFESWFGDLGERSSSVRMGRRVLPLGWAAVDDPHQRPSHPSSNAVDIEGTPTESVVLVKDGIVRDLLMSRVPRPDRKTTNGHGRGAIGQRASGRVDQLRVDTPKTSTEAKIYKQGLKLAASYGRDYVLVIRRLQEPAILNLEGGNFDGDANPLPPPVFMVRRYGDGHEEVVRGASFSGVHRWVLKDIVAAGRRVEGSYMAAAQGSADSLGPIEGMPTWISVPEVLIGEMELVPVPGDPSELPIVPLPVGH